eukprot:jgi/Mesvir1/13925/Mv16046-RA.1
MSGLNVPQGELDYLLRATPNMNQQNLEALAIESMLRSLQQPAPPAAAPIPQTQPAYVPSQKPRGPGRPPGAKNKPKVAWEAPAPPPQVMPSWAPPPTTWGEMKKPRKPRAPAPQWGWTQPPATFAPPQLPPTAPVYAPAPAPQWPQWPATPAVPYAPPQWPPVAPPPPPRPQPPPQHQQQQLAPQHQQQLDSLFNTPAAYTPASSRPPPDAGIPPQVYMREWTNVDAAARAAQPAATPVGELLRSIHAGEKVDTPSLIEARVDCASGVAKSLPRPRIVALAKQLYPEIPAQSIETATKADLCAMVADEAIEGITKTLCASSLYDGADSKTRLAAIAAYMTRSEAPESFAALSKEALCVMIANMLKPEQRASVMEKAGTAAASLPWKEWGAKLLGAAGDLGEGLGSMGALQHAPKWLQNMALAGGVLSKEGGDRMNFVMNNAGRFAEKDLGLWDRSKMQMNDAVNRGSGSWLGKTAGGALNLAGGLANAAAQMGLATATGGPLGAGLSVLQNVGKLASLFGGPSHLGKQYKTGKNAEACERAYACCVDAMEACHAKRIKKLEAFLKKNRSRVYPKAAASAGAHTVHQAIHSVSAPVCRRGVCSIHMEAGDGDYYTLCG